MLIKLAGMTVDVDARYRYTQEICRPYLAPADAVADFAVRAEEEDLAYEAARDAVAVREAEESPVAPARTAATPAILESAALYRKICHAALDYDVFLFHGSAIALDGVGYLFSAPSGTGKSTHTALWRQVFGDRVITVNDDKPLLRVTDSGVTVSGTPWDGKHHLSTPGEYPLSAICFLVRGETNHIREMTISEAYPHLLGQTYRPSDPSLLIRTLELVDRAAAEIKFYELTCNISPEAAEVARRGMEDDT